MIQRSNHQAQAAALAAAAALVVAGWAHQARGAASSVEATATFELATGVFANAPIDFGELDLVGTVVSSGRVTLDPETGQISSTPNGIDVVGGASAGEVTVKGTSGGTYKITCATTAKVANTYGELLAVQNPRVHGVGVAGGTQNCVGTQTNTLDGNGEAQLFLGADLSNFNHQPRAVYSTDRAGGVPMEVTVIFN